MENDKPNGVVLAPDIDDDVYDVPFDSASVTPRFDNTLITAVNSNNTLELSRLIDYDYSDSCDTPSTGLPQDELLEMAYKFLHEESDKGHSAEYLRGVMDLILHLSVNIDEGAE